MSSILPEGSNSNTPAPHSLRGVAHMMVGSPDVFTAEVGSLVSHIAYMHEHPVACDDCRQFEAPCITLESANTIAFAWLLKVVEERG